MSTQACIEENRLSNANLRAEFSSAGVDCVISRFMVIVVTIFLGNSSSSHKFVVIAYKAFQEKKIAK